MASIRAIQRPAKAGHYVLRTPYSVPQVRLKPDTTYRVLRTAYYVLRTAYCVLRTTYCVLRTAYCVLRTAYYVLRTTYCVLRTAYVVSAFRRTSEAGLAFQGRARRTRSP